MTRTVFKIGGSLLGRSDLRERLTPILAQQQAALIVPGGGPIADGVRQVHAAQPTVSEAAAHRAAFASLTASALLVADLIGVDVVDDWSDRRWSTGATAVADPLRFLVRAGRFDELPASWDVTSDSIALAIATAVQADRLVLLKSRDMPVSLTDAVADRAIDAWFPSLLGTAAVDWCDLTAVDPVIEATSWGNSGRAPAGHVRSTESTDLITEALVVAAKSHANQTRKGSNTPYITHPVEVSRVLRQHGFSEADASLHAAALLHDVVEDTSTSLEELREVFGDEVAAWVDGTSEVKVDAAGNPRSWADRKSDHIACLKTACWQVCAITLADKIHNLRDTLGAVRDADYWSRFNAKPDKQLQYQIAVNDACQRGDLLSGLASTHRHLIEDFRLAIS